MKRVEVPVIVTKSELDDPMVSLQAFKEGLRAAFIQLGEEGHNPEAGVDIVLKYRVVEMES